MNHAEINQEHLGMIVKSLMTEYSKKEVLDMLDSAGFSKIDNGYKVTYDCGTEDRFFFTLVHESEY